MRYPLTVHARLGSERLPDVGHRWIDLDDRHTVIARSVDERADQTEHAGQLEATFGVPRDDDISEVTHPAIPLRKELSPFDLDMLIASIFAVQLFELRNPFFDLEEDNTSGG